ncbi:hypothetical protein HPP92_022831 [Vanilla planifolia]|uniref:Uncharacterized protein n=1 Tax=Vanilla planifolia TaxID=51239 RepID=A0A835UCA1_VANPL|nr:hypothetical protein HPP92_022831 [Vanilla planifolia]
MLLLFLLSSCLGLKMIKILVNCMRSCEDNSSSDRVTLHLYLEETVSLICDCISSSSWASKRKSAKATTTLCEIMGDSLSTSHQVLLKCLLKEVGGRFWEGKDVILYALASLCTSCNVAMSTADPTAPGIILSSIASACTKKVKSYREAAFVCLKQIVKAFDDPESFNKVFPMLYDVCDHAALKMDTNTISSSAATDDNESASVAIEKVMDCVATCIHVAHVEDILKEKERCFSSLAPKLVECIRNVKVSQFHVAASECILEIVKLHRNIHAGQRRETDLKNELVRLTEVEKSEQAKTFFRRAIEILSEMEKDDL